MNRILIVLVAVLISCQAKKEELKKKELTISQKEVLEQFGQDLAHSFKNYKYDLIRNSWNSRLFKNRITGLDKTEKTVLNHYYESEFSPILISQNIEFVNKLKYNNGKIYYNKIHYYPTHAEVIYTLQYLKNIEFLKFRLEFDANKVLISDYYSYKDELWQSEKIKNIIRLNSTYTARSKNRREANESIIESDNLLRMGDSIQALAVLYGIPKTHLLGNGVSLKRINLASEIGDSVLAYAIDQERMLNESIYIRYLYGYYFSDSTELNQVFAELKENLELENHMVDSLLERKYFWN